jgi:hypothetical protein
MPSWLTFALPVATYLGGVLTKPLQALIEDWRARSKLRNSLYADLGHNLNVAVIRLAIALKNPYKNEDFLYSDFVKDSFTHALIDPSLFHQLRESTRVRLFYEILKGAEHPRGDEQFVGAIGLLIRNVSDGIKAKDYCRKSVYQHVSQNAKTLIDGQF